MSILTKKQKTIIWLAAVLLLCVATIPAAIWVTHTQTAEIGNSRARCEKKPGVIHKVVISGDAVSPITTHAVKCDLLVITNLDNQRLLAFGPHDRHISYDNVSEKLLENGESLEITLIRSGTYNFHDHDDPTVSGSFVVD